MIKVLKTMLEMDTSCEYLSLKSLRFLLSKCVWVLNVKLATLYLFVAHGKSGILDDNLPNLTSKSKIFGWLSIMPIQTNVYESSFHLSLNYQTSNWPLIATPAHLTCTRRCTFVKIWNPAKVISCSCHSFKSFKFSLRWS